MNFYFLKDWINAFGVFVFNVCLSLSRSAIAVLLQLSLKFDDFINDNPPDENSEDCADNVELPSSATGISGLCEAVAREICANFHRGFHSENTKN